MRSDLDPTATGSVTESCADCERTGCGEAFGRLIALEFQGVQPYAPFHTITVSAHYLQHPSLGTAGRSDWWGFIDVYLAQGLEAVTEVAESRRKANAAGRPVPPVDAPSGRPPPDTVGTSVTVVEVIGRGPYPMPVEGHASRMRLWASSIAG